MNLSNFMVQTKDVYHIAFEYARLLQCDLIASLGDTNGLGNVIPGTCLSSPGEGDVVTDDEFNPMLGGEWAFPERIVSGEPPSVHHGRGEQNADMEVSARSGGMMRLDQAGADLKSVCRSMARKVAQKLRSRAQQMLAKKIPGAYRFQALSFRASNRGEAYLRSAVSKLVQATMTPKRRRVGIQRISTRKAIAGYGVTKFSWSWAYRAAPGRQALPVHEWKARYYQRLAKRRKTQRKGVYRGITVPKTKHGRPRHVVNLAKAHGTVSQPFSEWNASEAIDAIMAED